MRKPQRVALIAAGKLTDSPLERIRGLAEHLGPVKSTSLRIASRLANTLRGGRAVADYEAFEASPLILISVPDAMVTEIVAELAASKLCWSRKAVVFCSNHLTGASLKPLADLGASTGSLGLIPAFDDQWIVVEGGKAVERQIRPLVSHRGVRVTFLEAGRKEEYLAAMALAGPDLLPALKDAAGLLRTAGVSNAEAVVMLEKQLSRTLRSYFRSGKIG